MKETIQTKCPEYLAEKVIQLHDYACLLHSFHSEIPGTILLGISLLSMYLGIASGNLHFFG
jgi:hypothetical protein